MPADRFVLNAEVSVAFSDEDIDAKMYYDVDSFRQRVDRRILPPRQLYWRVRSLFVLFGDKVDSKSKLPLFNKRAWSKANNVLKEILLGFYSDPPGISFYTNRLSKRGEPMVDQYGIALLDCNRGQMMSRPFTSSWLHSMELGKQGYRCQMLSYLNAGIGTTTK